jgi:hypothetical protein
VAAGTTELTLKDKHPDCDFTIEQLCRTKRLPKDVIWFPGMILITDGAHDRKHVVVSVTDLGVQEDQYGNPHQLWAVAMRCLGHFYADNRFKLSRTRKEFQREIYVKPGQPCFGQLMGFRPSQPIGDVKPFKVHKPFKSKVPNIPVKGADGSITDNGVVIIGPKSSPPPEAILDSFRLK